MKLCVVILTNGVPTVQNVKSTYKTLAFMANLATEDQDEAVYDALPKNKNFRLNYKKTKKTETNNEEICRVSKANNIMIHEYEKKKKSKLDT